ncbi:2-C-methyl-D-erythritol 4-phosphate cytidylyltransferase [Thalassotalea piscium]
MAIEKETKLIAKHRLVVIVPAAGIGKRMKAQQPKQYLVIDQYTILEHTVLRLLSHPDIDKVVIAISDDDDFFATTSLPTHEKVSTVVGGKERVDSVLAGLKTINAQEYPWVLVHDAARPCVSHYDISVLIQQCKQANSGGLLATPIHDTIKRATDSGYVSKTVNRDLLWRALTPQMYPTPLLTFAIEQALADDVMITDEASAIEAIGGQSLLVEGSGDNIKITRPDDLALAEFILVKQDKQMKETRCE